MKTLDQAIARIRAFRDERDWAQFHNPKDLAAGLAIEASELQEIFLWKNGSEIADVIEEKRTQITDEIADIGYFLLLLSHELNIDLLSAIEAKLEKNKAKYPAAKVRGSSKKYTEYQQEP